jgi:hypothetical protein
MDTVLNCAIITACSLFDNTDNTTTVWLQYHVCCGIPTGASDGLRQQLLRVHHRRAEPHEGKHALHSLLYVLGVICLHCDLCAISHAMLY